MRIHSRSPFVRIVFAAEDGAGSGVGAGAGAGAPASGAAAIAAAAAASAGGTAAPSAGAGAPQAGAPQDGAPQAGAWAKPDWLPDHLAGKTADEALDKTFKALDGFRQKAATRGEVPKDVAGYTYTPPDDLKAYFKEKDDPVLGVLSGISHKLGLSKGEYEAIVGGTVGELVKAGVIPAAFDPKAEFAKIGKGLNLPDTAEGKASLAKVVTETVAFADQLGTQLGLGDGPKAMLAALADTGDGLLALNAIRGRLGTRGPQIEGAQVGANATSKEDLRAMASDPRIDPNSPKFDQRVRKQYDEDYRRIFG